MAEPGDHSVIATGRLRASHADRERVIGALSAAFAAGLLAKDDFELGVARTLTSRTYADLAAVSAGLAAVPAGAARSLTRMRSAAAWGACGLIVSLILTVVVMPAGTTKGVVVSTAILIYAMSWLLAAIIMLAGRRRG
jgi:hypothetical protein